jgi:hypothetical protein
VTPNSVTNPALREAAARLAGERVLTLEPAGKGANSQAFRLETQTRTLALKCYPRRAGETRDRLDVEWRTLAFLRAAGIVTIPEGIARDDTARLMLMEWIEGPLVGRHGSADLKAAIAFMESIFAASDLPGAESFPPAAEACLSASWIVDQIKQRLEQFADDPMLETFLQDTFQPHFERACESLSSNDCGSLQLPRRLQRLIPADFGFHNAIRTSSGALRFIDFDYFGWDDPVKLAADFVLHPAMSLSAAEKELVVASLATARPEDDDFLRRLKTQMPLYALRWTLILLNVFRRDRAGELPVDPAARRARLEQQIEKARWICARAQ